MKKRLFFCMAPLAFILLASGCDLFNGKPEIDLEKAIDSAVAWANAPILDVYARADIRYGTPSPNGQVVSPNKPRTGYSFTINFTPVSSYSFLYWEAFTLDGRQLGSEAVEFTDRASLETNVTVKQALAVELRPFCVERPVIRSKSPEGTAVRVIRNHPIEIIFSQKIDKKSFMWNSDENDPIYKNSEGKFKNIEIIGKENRGYGIERPYEEYFEDDLIIDGAFLTITAKQSPMIPIDSNISVFLSRDITTLVYEGGKTLGSVSMGSPVFFNYGVNDEVDREGPKIREKGNIWIQNPVEGDIVKLEGDTTEGGGLVDSGYTNLGVFRPGSRKIRVAFGATDNYSSVSSVKIKTLTQKFNFDGNPATAADITPNQVITVSRLDTEKYPEFREFAASGTDNSDGYHGYMFEYDLPAGIIEGNDGVWEIAFVCLDVAGNESDNTTPGGAGDPRSFLVGCNNNRQLTATGSNLGKVFDFSGSNYNNPIVSPGTPDTYWYKATPDGTYITCYFNNPHNIQVTFDNVGIQGQLNRPPTSYGAVELKIDTPANWNWPNSGVWRDLADCTSGQLYNVPLAGLGEINPSSVTAVTLSMRNKNRPDTEKIVISKRYGRDTIAPTFTNDGTVGGSPTFKANGKTISIRIPAPSDGNGSGIQSIRIGLTFAGSTGISKRSWEWDDKNYTLLFNNILKDYSQSFVQNQNEQTTNPVNTAIGMSCKPAGSVFPNLGPNQYLIINGLGFQIKEFLPPFELTHISPSLDDCSISIQLTDIAGNVSTQQVSAYSGSGGKGFAGAGSW